MMKTKFLLAAIALPLAFTACTDDVLVEAGNGQLANIESRATLGDVTFVAGGVDSRVTTDGKGKWEWENTDKFSAHLIDAAKFTVAATDTALYTNYIYSKTAEGYTTTSQMVEGMYWFYAPANEDKNDREMIKFALPAEQTMDVEDPDAHIVENSVFFSPVYKMEAKNNEANVTVPLDMYNWYTVALIPFTNDTKDDLEIQKIVLKTTSALAADGKINAGKIAQKFLKVYDADEEAWVDYTNEDGDVLCETPMEEDYYYGDADDNAFILNVEKTLAPKETFTAKMLVPAGDAGVCYVTVVYADGEGSVFTTTSLEFNHHAQKAVFGVSNGKANAKKIKSSNISAVVDNYVMNNEDIINYLAANHAQDITLSQVGEWDINADALAAIAANSGDVTFDKDITVVNEGTKKIELSGLNNNVTLKGGKFTLEAYGHNVTVEAGELELTEAGAYETITNKGGKITINKTITADAVINNEGELVFAATNTIGATGIGALTNGTYKVEDDGTVKYTVGKITINANKTLNVGVASSVLAVKNSKVVVNGILKIVDNEVGADVVLNEGTMEIAAGAKIVAAATIKNNGTIENSGIIDNIINAGTIKNQVATARVIFGYDNNPTPVNPEGVIDNTALGYVAGKEYTTASGTHNQTILYHVTTATDNAGLLALDRKIKGYGINTLKFTAGLSLNGEVKDAAGYMQFTGVKRVVFGTGSSLALGNNTMIGWNVTELNIEDNVTFSGYDMNNSGLGFKKDVEIKIKEGKKLTINYMAIAPIGNTAKVDFILMNKTNATTGYTTWAQLATVESNVALGANGKVYGLSTAEGATKAVTGRVAASTATNGTNGNGVWTVNTKYYDTTSGTIQ